MILPPNPSKNAVATNIEILMVTKILLLKSWNVPIVETNLIMIYLKMTMDMTVTTKMNMNQNPNNEVVNINNNILNSNKKRKKMKRNVNAVKRLICYSSLWY